MEFIFNLIFSISDLWTKTREPFLDEYRGYMRNIITFTTMSILLFIAVLVISPSDEPVQGLGIMIYQVKYYLSMGVSAAFICFSVASLWNCLLLYLFFRKYGTYD